MSTADELSTYLATELSLTEATNLFVHEMPDTPDAVLTLYETGGSGSEHGFGIAGLLYEFPSVMVIARGAPDDYATPRALAESAYRSLAEIQAEALSGTSYHMVRPLNPPNGALGKDEKRRPRFSFNVLIEKELSA